MRLGIDASNLRSGGTVTHLTELLRVAEPSRHGFESVTVWAGSAVLARIESRDWLVKVPQALLEQDPNPFKDRRHLYRAYWQRFKLRSLARAAGCDLLFVPGGMDSSGFAPIVTMSRNMLPFDMREARRYGWSLSFLRLLLLRFLQLRTFRRAAGLIFLTGFAERSVREAAGKLTADIAVIPHGVSHRFVLPPRPQREMSQYSEANPLRIIYVSTVDIYKHQWNVVEAIATLRVAGYPICLDLIGPANGGALTRLQQTLERLDCAGYVRYRGSLSHTELAHAYQQADLKVFASSCENMPNILLESMAAGLPIACAERGPMPDILGDAGVYFDPEVPASIAAAVEELLVSPTLRARNAQAAFSKAQAYSWRRCAEETFSFLAKCARRAGRGSL